MPKVNVYLPDALASAVKEANVPVSAVCQSALAEAVERVARTRQGIAVLSDPTSGPALVQRIGEGVRRRMTPRLVAALRIAGTDDEGRARPWVSSLDLLRGLLDDGENLSVRLLLSQGVDLEALSTVASRGDQGDVEPRAREAGDGLIARLTMPGRLACAAALETVIELGHNYVGCEHLLLGLAASESRARDLLIEHGIQAAALRQAINAATAGVAAERSRAATRDADVVADLTRRLEAVERRLDARD